MEHTGIDGWWVSLAGEFRVKVLHHDNGSDHTGENDEEMQCKVHDRERRVCKNNKENIEWCNRQEADHWPDQSSSLTCWGFLEFQQRNIICWGCWKDGVVLTSHFLLLILFDTNKLWHARFYEKSHSFFLVNFQWRGRRWNEKIWIDQTLISEWYYQ